MIRLRHKLLIDVFRVFDQLVLAATALGIVYLRPEAVLQGRVHEVAATFRLEDTIGVVVLGVGWVLIFEYFIRYKADRLVALSSQLKAQVKATILASFWLMIISVLFSIGSFNIANLMIFFAVVTVAGIASRLFLYLLLLTARRSGYNYRFLLMVGASGRACQIAARIEEKPELGYKIVGFVAETPRLRDAWHAPEQPNWRVLGLLGELRAILTQERVDEIMVCLSDETRFSDIATIVQLGHDLGIVVRIMPDGADAAVLRNLHVEQFEEECVVTLFREQMLVQLLVKRVIDAALSLALLVLLAPLMLLVAVLIRLTSPGPVLFAQNRVGMNQRLFKLYKFRSMVVDAEERRSAIAHLNERDGPVFKIENDPRITPIGRFIRKTSIDELPQLFNVLTGKMSLVGPRPPLPEEVERYAWLFRKRLSVKPGITCIWQTQGRNGVSFERWMEMDHEYIENWSLWLDLKILLRTVFVVLTGRGAS